MEKNPIDVARDLLKQLQENPQAIDSLKEQAPAAAQPIEVAKQLIKHLNENPAQVEELKKTLLAAPMPPTPSPEPTPKPIDLAGQLLKALRGNPKAIEELSKAKGKELDGDKQDVRDSENPEKIQSELDKIKEGDKSIIRESMVQDMTGKVTGSGKDTGPGQHSGPKKQDSVKDDAVEKEKSVKGVTDKKSTEKAELSAAKQMPVGAERKQMIKDELKAEWKPRFCKSAAPAGATLQLPKKPMPKPSQKPPLQLKAEIPTDASKPASIEAGKCAKSALPADASKPAKIEAGKCCKGEYDSPERRKAMIKEELKAEWKPRFAKKDEMAAGQTPADANLTSMKAQKDPSAKPVMGQKIIKPKDVIEGGAAGMAVPKAKLGLAPKPKVN